ERKPAQTRSWNFRSRKIHRARQMDGRMGNPAAAHARKRLVCRPARAARCHSQDRHRYESFSWKSSAVRLARRDRSLEAVPEKECGNRKASLGADPKKVAA